MRTSAPAVDPEQEVRRINQRVNGFMASLVGLNVLVMLSALWGQWRTMGLILLLSGCGAVLNVLVARGRPVPTPLAWDEMRMGLNLSIVVALGHVTGWLFSVWLFLPLHGLWMRHPLGSWRRVVRYVLFGAFTLAALIDGAPPLIALTLLILTLIIAGSSGAYLRMTELTLGGMSRRQEELSHSLTELDLTHRRAREQERLSSLGMLAAGIAHEINNPMSYVKSNLHALQHELGRAELPASLREYTDEVLPETLEGVLRVCSIVADLRRFAKGDPEALIPYDLNEEVSTALRITRGRLQAHCDVEVKLEPLPPMLGHPRQISQVVVNLLLNAAQSMKRRGQVFISTRTDGEDDVVLEVRDTGEGMGPDVLAHLFQPFFTTRPAGEGTGLGLAVVHGIITSHGGRVRVQSAPGQGSTFSVRLPRVPPFKFTRLEPEAPAEEPTGPQEVRERPH
ncbi:sensor histidine kinase [Melittangium boletus]|uniref:sensor histidine kinase n=1 Tax=Melittangium boletus TaxID=83453 RepID=UPI003DA5CD84